jgi:hypothetical protein
MPIGAELLLLVEAIEGVILACLEGVILACLKGMILACLELVAAEDPIIGDRGAGIAELYAAAW